MITVKLGQLWQHYSNKTYLVYIVVGLVPGSDRVYVKEFFTHNGEPHLGKFTLVLTRYILENYYVLIKDVASPSAIWKELNEV